MHVLANVDETSYVPARTVRWAITRLSPDESALQSAERVFQFGHKADLFQNSAFKALFLNAIRWASER